MAPGFLLDHSKDNEANQQEADPDDRAEMTSRLSGVVHRLASPQPSLRRGFCLEAHHRRDHLSRLELLVLPADASAAYGSPLTRCLFAGVSDWGQGC